MKIWSLLALLWCVMAASSVEASVVVTMNGDRIACRMTPGQKRSKDDAVLSPDGHTVAYMRYAKSDALPPDEEAGSLWIGDCHTGVTRLLLPARFEGKSNDEEWVTLDWPVFSPDGRQIYISAFYGGDGGLVQRVDVATGRHAFVVGGELDGIIRSGPYRGDLFATQHTSLKGKDGSEYAGYPYYVFSLDGAVVKRIPDSEKWDQHMLNAWLRRQGWKVR